jgi:hypothetical protein
MRLPSRAVAVVLVVVVSAVSGAVYVGAADAFLPGSDEAEQELTFEETAEERGLTYNATRTRYRGSLFGNEGAYVADYDNDLDPDVLVMGGEKPVLFENRDGNFERSGALPALETETQFRSALFFDYDNDGDQDLLLIPRVGELTFLENVDGEDRYAERDVGLNATVTGGIGASAADYDRDGCLDVFVIQYGNWSENLPTEILNEKGLVAVPDHVKQAAENHTIPGDNGKPNMLFNGDCGEFERADEAGIEGTRWSLATSFVDFTGNGYPDIHVANDFNNDTLYVNQGDGTFERTNMSAATDRNGMASEVADVNGDGQLDVFVTNIYFEENATTLTGVRKRMLSLAPGGNNLLVNRGDGEFEDRGTRFEVAKGGWGWAAVFGDFDNDGDQDLFHTTSSDVPLVGWDETGFDTPMLFERTGDGFESRNASEAGFAPTNGRGAAALDVDGDGGLDLVIGDTPPYRFTVTDSGQARTVLTERVKLYENQGHDGNWTRIVVRAGDEERVTLGAEVEVVADDTTATRVKNARSDYLSQDSRFLHVGLGDAGEIETLRVEWPDGTERTFTGVDVNRTVVVTPEGLTYAENATAD